MKTSMKRILGISVLMVIVFAAGIQAQTKKTSNEDDQRMMRDMEVAKNVLSTLIKQQFEKRVYFPLNVEGEYVAGYGATFRLPGPLNESYAVSLEGASIVMNGYSFRSIPTPNADFQDVQRARQTETAGFGQDEVVSVTVTDKPNTKAIEKNKEPKVVGTKTIEGISDSARATYNNHIIEASKNFLTDYGDLISQMPMTEKIVITNQNDGQRYFNKTKRAYISVEALKSDMSLFRQGKLSREDFISKIKIVNSETVPEVDPDIELFSSILSRLYQQDLSKTYFVDRSGINNYERLKDFGVIFYMQMRSSTQTINNLHTMPTLQLREIDKQTRDSKVKELYPVFEKEIKEHVLDYGRTIKSLKDDESLILNIRLTECKDCGIPASLELSLKESVLKDFNSGKLTKDAALTKINVKKGVNQ